MALCVDLVLNHTAAEHPWARAAAAGDPTYRDFYRIFPDRDRARPLRADPARGLPRPGARVASPTSRASGWVWTTFNTFQWDLDWSNPEVFAAMLGTVLDLANRGVDVLRLDAAPFLWKREGTDCQNQPEVHLLLQALRALLRDRGARACWSRPRRSSRRSSSCSTSAATTGSGPSATWPTTTS